MRLNLRPGRVNRHALYVIRQAEVGSRESPPPERAIRGSARVVSLAKPAPRVAVRAAEPSVVIQGRKPGRPAAAAASCRAAGCSTGCRSAGPGEVVLLCAPAGSGKTALLRSWVESDELAGPVAWVSVERGERDAQRFWLSVVDALAGAARSGLVERVGATPAFAGEAVVERLLSDLRALERPVVLVIDDLHELRSAEALRLLERFLAALPAALGSCSRRARTGRSGCTACGWRAR